MALALLGLRAVRAERIERDAQMREQRKQVARLADQALANAFTGLESELNRLDPDEPRSVEVAGGALPGRHVFVRDRRGILTFQPDNVYFGDSSFGRAVVEWPAALESMIENAQAAEAQGRAREAVAAYRRIAAAQPKLSGWAESSIARIQGRRGLEAARAVLADTDWNSSDALTPTGLPLALTLCAYVEELPAGERPGLATVLRQTLDRLRGGRWLLSYDERRFYDSELRALLQSAASTEDPPDNARLVEVAALERLVRKSAPFRADGPTRSFGRDGPQGFLVLAMRSSSRPDESIGFGIAQAELSRLLDQVLRPLLASPPVAAVRDGQGNLIWGELKGQVAGSGDAMRCIPEWEIWFSAPAAPMMDRRSALWYGFIALLLTMLAAGLVMTVHLVRREAELARMQNEFIAAVSHEFRSPLAGIRLLVERIVSGRFQRADSAPQYRAALNSEIGRLEEHVDRLLDAQKIGEGRKQYNFAPASMVEIARAAVNALGPRAQAKEIALEIETDLHAVETLMDAAAVKEAIENVLDNAIKYSASGTRVRVVVWADDNVTGVDVCDQGAGISRHDLPRIFDRFYRGRSGGRQDARGTGLGLWLVKAVIEAHGGTVEVTSQPCRGSRFSLRLPSAKQAEDGLRGQIVGWT